MALGNLDSVHAEHVFLEGAVLNEAVVAVGAHVLLFTSVCHTVVPAVHE